MNIKVLSIEDLYLNIFVYNSEFCGDTIYIDIEGTLKVEIDKIQYNINIKSTDENPSIIEADYDDLIYLKLSGEQQDIINECLCDLDISKIIHGSKVKLKSQIRINKEITLSYYGENNEK